MWDQPVARSLFTNRTAQTQNKRIQTFMSLVGFKPTISVLERTKTVHALDSAATVIGYLWLTFWYYVVGNIFLWNVYGPNCMRALCRLMESENSELRIFGHQKEEERNRRRKRTSNWRASQFSDFTRYFVYDEIKDKAKGCIRAYNPIWTSWREDFIWWTLKKGTIRNLYVCTPRVEAGKNTSTVIPASRKRRRKWNRISLKWDSASRPKKRLMKTFFG
jgi:hypothetical protein